MINGKKIIVVLPAYNAAQTLVRTIAEIPPDIVDETILVDDFSKDDTIALARTLQITHIVSHDKNYGYGRNQKTCYNKALERGADIVIMLHPDYQYTPKLIHSMAYIIANGVYPVVIASRILGRGALKGGMPLYKYIANRILTLFQNIMLSQKLSEYHTGFRAYSAGVLRSISYNTNSDNFVFDNEVLSQITFKGYGIAEVTCPTHYFEEASSIRLRQSIVYGLGVVKVSIVHRLCKWKLMKGRLYK